MSAHHTPPAKADAAAWLAVAAGTIGALMATLDTSIVNAALPTIQGEVGASGSEGTWISTAYLVAEIIIIPLTGWLERVFGLRNFLVTCTILFVGFSVLCGVATNLNMMIIGRVGQGVAGGGMIPTALTIVATRLPPDKQPVGVALFGMTAVLGPVVGPVIGGWLTENASWHYLFFINVPSASAFSCCCLSVCHTRKPNRRKCSKATGSASSASSSVSAASPWCWRTGSASSGSPRTSSSR